MDSRNLHSIPETEILELIEKLDVRGPRYTSYPTVPVWHAESIRSEYQKALLETSRKGDPVALYVHLPFCQKRCLYCGCNSHITRDEERINTYLDILEKEILSVSSSFEQQLEHSWLHLGGGTPTHLAPERLERLLDVLIEVFPGAAKFERSVEVDPRITTMDHLKVLAAHGFKRVSIGLQDFDIAVQMAVRREFSFEEMQGFVAQCRYLGFKSVNIDLIYGLPLQNRASWNRTLELVQQLRPDRLACFGYAHLPEKIKHQRAIDEEQLPSARERLGLLLDAHKFFTSNGYTSIGFDHFALPKDKLAIAQSEGCLWRNFMGYTEIRGLQMIGFGASAISELDSLFAQNVPLPELYNEMIEKNGWAVTKGHELDEDDKLRKQIINDLMCNLVIKNPNQLAMDNASRDDLIEAFHSLQPFEELGFIETTEDSGYRVSSLGQLFLRNLAMPFDRYLPRQQVTYSTTI